VGRAACLLALALVAHAAGCSEARAQGIPGNIECGGAIGGGCSAIGSHRDFGVGAIPAARYGDPAAPTFGIPTTAPISGMTLLAQYVGDDVTSGGTGTWTGTGSSAADLTGQGDATPTLAGLRTIPATDYVDVNGNRYQTASAPGVSLGTQDLLVLAYLQLSSSGNTIPISNRAGFNSGFELMVQSNGNVRCYVDTTSLGVVNDFVSTDTDPGAWTLAGCIIDRDGFFRWRLGTRGRLDVTGQHRGGLGSSASTMTPTRSPLVHLPTAATPTLTPSHGCSSGAAMGA
jgi:hypothetical protein